MKNNNKLHTPAKSTAMRGPMGRGQMGFEKPKNFKIAMKKLFAYNKSFLPLTLLALVLSVVATIFTLILPNKLEEITKIIQRGLLSEIDILGVNNIAVLLVVLLLLSAIFNYVQGFIMATLTQKATYKMRGDISVKINKLPLKYLDSQPYGDILSKVTNDVDTIGRTLNNSLVSVVSGITMLLGSLLMMFITNWILAITAVLSTLLGVGLMGLIMSKSQKHFVAQQAQLGQLNAHIQEAYTGHSTVKVLNAEDQFSQEFSTINNKLFSSALKSQFYSGLMMPIMNFIGNLGYVIVCVVGATLVINNQMNFAVIIAFMLYIRFFSQPLSQIAQAMTNFQSAAAAGERVFDFLGEHELESENEKTNTLTSVLGNVEFKNVVFGYEEDRTIIKNFSAKIKAGQKVAIVGPTGAGKTTIVNLLMRFYELDGGTITVDGVDIKSLTRANVHELFGMVLQDTWLYEDTILNNIKYSKTNISDKRVVKACELIGLDHFIKTLPNGYNTKLTETTTISAGQKQLLTIARAMVQDSPMLILDEATSSVDTRTEILIQSAMDLITKGRTSFVIAHRLSTIKNADVILVLEDGDIVEQGNHETLIKKNGSYSKLYNSQFEQV